MYPLAQCNISHEVDGVLLCYDNFAIVIWKDVIDYVPQKITVVVGTKVRGSKVTCRTGDNCHN